MEKRIEILIELLDEKWNSEEDKVRYFSESHQEYSEGFSRGKQSGILDSIELIKKYLLDE